MPVFDPDTLDVAGGHFIAGRRLAGGNIATTVLCPFDAPCQEIHVATANDVDHAVEDAARAWRHSGWASAAPRERIGVMRRWAALIEEGAKTLAPLEAICSIRPVGEAAECDIPYSADAIRFFFEFADKIGGKVAAAPARRVTRRRRQNGRCDRA